MVTYVWRGWTLLGEVAGHGCVLLVCVEAVKSIVVCDRGYCRLVVAWLCGRM